MMWSSLSIPVGVTRIRISLSPWHCLSLKDMKIFCCCRRTMRNLEVLGVFLVVAVTVFLVYQYTATRSHMVNSIFETQTRKETYSTWPTFNIKVIHNRDWYIDNCFNSQYSEDLEDIFRNLIPIWSETENDECKNLYEKFVALYEVHDRHSRKLNLPPPFYKRVSQWLKGDKALLEKIHKQHLIHIFHPLTAEHTVYNSVRSKRPMPTKDTDVYEWVNKLSAETEKDCDFCNYMNMTAVDEFDRHVTKDTVRVSNTFKVESWHSMIVTKQHHPTNLSKEVVVNMLKESMSWVYEVSQKDPQYIYTNVAWDILYHAGASQIHPHFHMMMAPDHYYGSFELLRSAAQRYYDHSQENYFNTLLEVHAALGLVVEYGDAVAIATLSGKADMEVMFLSDFPGESLYRLIYFTFSAYHDTFSQLCKSLAGAWPALGMSKEASLGRIPAVVRMVSRGDCTSSRTDFSSYEIFQIVYRSHDPWQVARAIRRAISKYDN